MQSTHIFADIIFHRHQCAEIAVKLSQKHDININDNPIHIIWLQIDLLGTQGFDVVDEVSEEHAVEEYFENL